MTEREIQAARARLEIYEEAEAIRAYARLRADNYYHAAQKTLEEGEKNRRLFMAIADREYRRINTPLRLTTA